MMSGVPLETCSAFNKLWNNKFYYKLRLVGISTESYYDTRIHEYQTGVALFHRNVQTNSGCRPVLFPTVKQLGRKPDHSPLFNTEVKNACMA
jgi:hypothetical protein